MGRGGHAKSTFRRWAGACELVFRRNNVIPPRPNAGALGAQRIKPRDSGV